MADFRKITLFCNTYPTTENYMKKLTFFIILLTAAAFAGAVQIELSQKVSRRENTEKWGVPGSYNKDVSRKKTFTLEITNMATVEVVAVFFAKVGDETFYKIISDTVTPNKPLIYEYSASASSNKANYAALGVKTSRGNDKVEACAFVFDKKSGKFLGQKYTSKHFADNIMKEYKDAIIAAAKGR